MVNSGTLRTYNIYIGKYDQKKADETFKEGIILAILAAVLIIVGMMALKGFYIHALSPSDTMSDYLREYYEVIIFYLCLDPLSCVLDNTLVADGGEKLSAIANILEITVNVVLSIIFAGLYGVRGIAAASIISKLLFFLVISRWSFARIRKVSFHSHLKLREFGAILACGCVKTSIYIFTSLRALVLIKYSISHFEEGTLTLVIIAVDILDLSMVYLGLAMAAQPLIGTLRGEKNTRGIKTFMGTVFKTMFLFGAGTSLLMLLSAPLTIRVFGLNDQSLLDRGAAMARWIGVGFAFQALVTLFFVYYFLIERNGLSLLCSALKEFLMPVLLCISAAMITQSETGLWIGLALAPEAAFLIIMLAARIRKKTDSFPWLVPSDLDERTWFYYFELTKENAVDLSRSIVDLMKEKNCIPRITSLVGVISEELLLLIMEKNPSENRIKTECDLIMEETGLKLIVRDSGLEFDATDPNSGIESLRSYFVSRVLTLPQHKFYLTTTGYNRNELIFTEEKE